MIQTQKVLLLANPDRKLSMPGITQPETFEEVTIPESLSSNPIEFYNDIPDDTIPTEENKAFVNRVVKIPFDHAIPKEKQDKNLLNKMSPELPALFNHALQAYQRLVENNYNWAGNFPNDILVVNSGMSFNKTLSNGYLNTDGVETDNA